MKVETNDISAEAQLGKVSKTIKQDVKNHGPRDLPSSAWGYLCACDTPDGKPTGLINSLANFSRLSRGVDVSLLARLLHATGMLDDDFAAVPAPPPPPPANSRDRYRYQKLLARAACVRTAAAATTPAASASTGFVAADGSRSALQGVSRSYQAAREFALLAARRHRAQLAAGVVASAAAGAVVVRINGQEAGLLAENTSPAHAVQSIRDLRMNGRIPADTFAKVTRWRHARSNGLKSGAPCGDADVAATEVEADLAVAVHLQCEPTSAPLLALCLREAGLLNRVFIETTAPSLPASSVPSAPSSTLSSSLSSSVPSSVPSSSSSSSASGSSGALCLLANKRGDARAGASVLPPHHTVFVNGNAIGALKGGISATQFVARFRQLRRKRVFPHDCSVHFDPSAGVFVRCDSGRFVKAVYVAECLPSVPAILAHAVAMHCNAFTELETRGAIEWIDPFEEAGCVVAVDASAALRARPGFYTHCHLTAMAQFGSITSLIPFSDHNQGPRNIYHTGTCAFAWLNLVLLASCHDPLSLCTHTHTHTYRLVTGWGSIVYGLLFTHLQRHRDR